MPTYEDLFPGGLADGSCSSCGAYVCGDQSDQNHHVQWHVAIYNKIEVS